MDDFDWDFGNDSPRSGRTFELGCWIVVCVVVVGITGIVWIVHHQKQIEACLFFVFLVGGLWFARGYLRWPQRRPRLDATALPMLLADIEPGPVHTTGLVGVGAQLIHAPLGGQACAFFRVLVEHEGKVLFEARSADELVLDDGGGNKVVLRLDGAKWLLHRWQELDASDPQVVTYFAERGLRFDRPVRVRVAWIAPHELVFVRGVARETAQAPVETGYRTSEGKSPLEIAAAPERPVLVSLDPIPLKRVRLPA